MPRTYGNGPDFYGHDSRELLTREDAARKVRHG